jgi:hypothetical protein
VRIQMVDQPGMPKPSIAVLHAVYDYLPLVRVWFALHGTLSIANFIFQNSLSSAVKGRPREGKPVQKKVINVKAA